MAHKESKLKREELRKMFARQKYDNEIKTSDRKAMEWFKEEPYQLQYQERMKGNA